MQLKGHEEKEQQMCKGDRVHGSLQCGSLASLKSLGLDPPYSSKKKSMNDILGPQEQWRNPVPTLQPGAPEGARSNACKSVWAGGLLPSFSIPTLRHFMKRQAWHDLRLRLVISHSLVAGQLYSMFPVGTHSRMSKGKVGKSLPGPQVCVRGIVPSLTVAKRHL